MFKVGDIVTGIRGKCGGYGITDENMTKGEIVGYYPDSVNDILVKVLEHETMKKKIGSSFWVNSNNFKLVESAKVNKDEGVKSVDKFEGLKMEYNEDKKCGFIIVNEKFTICLPISKGEFDRMGVSSKLPNDTYNEEMGKALALYRTK